MTKTASRARTSRAIKQVPQTAQDNADQRDGVFAHQPVRPGVNASEPDPHIDAIASGKLPTSAPDTEATQASETVAQQHLLTLTEDEGRRVIEARCMLQLLEDMTLSAEREITMSSGPLAVMMAVIRKKLTFKSRLMPVDAAGHLQNR